MWIFRAVVWATLAIPLALGAVAPAAPLYTLLNLGSLDTVGHTYSSASDINELGQVVGSSVNNEGRQEAFRTAPNSPINRLTDGLGYFGGPRRGSVAYAINDIGQVVGYVRGPGENDWDRAFVIGPDERIESHMGTFTGGNHSRAYAINNAGQIAGWSHFPYTPSDPNGIPQHAFRTSSSRTLVDGDDLGTLSNSRPPGTSTAFGMNELGQVVGSSINDEGRLAAFRTAPNAPINPVTDDVGTFGGNTLANAINIHGQVVGISRHLGSPFERAFRTAPGARINPLTDDLGTLGGDASWANDINDFGIVVGGAYGPGDNWRAFVYIEGEGLLDLNNLIAGGGPDGWTLTDARAINNKGQIVGTMQSGGRDRPFLLTPVPEPTLLAVVPLAVLLVARRTAPVTPIV